MAAIAPTDLGTLEAAFKTAILGITPTHSFAKGDTWRHFEGELGVDDLSGAGTRTFFFEWGQEDEVPPEEAPYTPQGYPLSAEMRIVAKYDLPDSLVTKVVNYDHRQIRDVLEDLIPAETGLLWVNGAGWSEDEDESGHSSVFIHSYEVAYFKARS